MTVSLRFESASNDDDDGDDDVYGAFTHVHADILWATNKVIGYIDATLVDRQRIPEGCFYETFDEHSAEMQWVGCALLENRYGRPKLSSMNECDDAEFDFMYISKLHVHLDDEEEEKNLTNDKKRKHHLSVTRTKPTKSDVAAMALREFLHSSPIKGNLKFGCWHVSSAAYVLDPLEAMSRQERAAFETKRYQRIPFADADDEDDPVQKQQEEERMNALARQDAIPFLRNGFFQDSHLATSGGGSNNGRILVATYGQWEQPLLSQAQVSSIRLLSGGPPNQPTGVDAQILSAVTKASSETAIMDGRFVQCIRAPGEGPPDPTQTTRALKTKLRTLIQQQGGSIRRSNALHGACANNSLAVLNVLLELEPSTKNATDSSGMTPLMVAAQSAAGRCSINGIRETTVIDRLLAVGANKDLTDPAGMTAYGHYKKSSDAYGEMMMAMTGGGSGGARILPSLLALEAKLCPEGGPSEGDHRRGKGKTTDGYVDYEEIDHQADLEMGQAHTYRGRHYAGDNDGGDD